VVEVAVSPFYGGGSFIVAEVAHQDVREVVTRGEDVAGDHVALYVSELDFKLVEPGGIGRGKVQMHLRVIGEERGGSPSLANRLSMMVWTSRPPRSSAMICRREAHELLGSVRVEV